MERESQRIHSQLDARRHSSRVARVGKVVESFRLSLPHPCDFSPSTADVCWIPEVRKAIVSGTDEEFQKCETELQSRIPELSAIWLEERRKFFLGLLPQDSPSLKHLALATTLFDCTRCYRTGSGMRIEAALSHACLGYGYGTSHEAEFPSATKAKSFHQAAGTPWDSGFSSYRYAVELPALAREVVLECGEDPDVMTTQEMNNKFHRFACFCRDGAVNVLTWSKVVRFRTRLLDGPMLDLRHPVSLSTGTVTTTKKNRVGSCGLMNCRNIYLVWIAETIGVASIVGKQGGLPGMTSSSVL